MEQTVTIVGVSSSEYSQPAVTTDLRNANLRLLSETTLTVSNGEDAKASRYINSHTHEFYLFVFDRIHSSFSTVLFALFTISQIYYRDVWLNLGTKEAKIQTPSKTFLISDRVKSMKRRRSKTLLSSPASVSENI